MSTIDEKFSKLIAENTAVEEEVIEEEDDDIPYELE